MTTTLWLRISSVVALLFAAGHTLGGRKKWSPTGDNPMLQAMSSMRFDTLGANRPMIAAFVLAQVAGAVIAWRFIFPVPALFSVVLVVTLAIAFAVAR